MLAWRASALAVVAVLWIVHGTFQRFKGNMQHEELGMECNFLHQNKCLLSSLPMSSQRSVAPPLIHVKEVMVSEVPGTAGCGEGAWVWTI